MTVTTLERTPERGATGRASAGAEVLQHKPKASGPQPCCVRQLAHALTCATPQCPHTHLSCVTQQVTWEHSSISSELSFWDTNSAALMQAWGLTNASTEEAYWFES